MNPPLKLVSYDEGGVCYPALGKGHRPLRLLLKTLTLICYQIGNLGGRLIWVLVAGDETLEGVRDSADWKDSRCRRRRQR